MGICAVFKITKGVITFLGKKYSEGYWYSTLTNKPGTFDTKFLPIEEYLDEDRDAGITLFTSETGARDFIGETQDLYVINFDRLCSFLDSKSKK